MKQKTIVISIAGFAFALLIAGFVGMGQQGRFFSADLLTSEDADFNLWYISDVVGEREWNIPKRVGGTAVLPLGITSGGGGTDPIDSIEFRLEGIDSALEYDSTSTFPGFHVDTVVESGNTFGTNNITVYLTSESYVGGGENPDTPIGDIGDLIEATDEILTLSFRVVSEPTDIAASSFAISGVLAVRDGEFSLKAVDGNPSQPGNNPGTIIITPEGTPDFPQVERTTPFSPSEVELDFTTEVLDGSGFNGSENKNNYVIYACGSHIPQPDVEHNDYEACANMNQGNVDDPGIPRGVSRDNVNRDLVYLTTATDFVDGAHYIVFIKNVSDEAGEYIIPEEGIFSQSFQWTSHPLVTSIVPKDPLTLEVFFDNNVCPATNQYGAGEIQNYELFACNPGVTIEECLQVNSTPLDEISISNVSFDGDRTVTLTTEKQEERGWYALQVRNVANQECEVDSATPVNPPYYADQFRGYTPGGISYPVLGISSGVALHLPWREELHISPVGGQAPYTFTAIPSGEVIIDETNPNDIVITALLQANDGAPLQDERDINLVIRDATGKETSAPIHILRRGDVGGREDRYLDKTDIQDVNDVSAGWKQ